MNDDNIYFTPDLTAEEIEEAFEDETWIENVTEAALFGATNCFQKGKDNYEIMHDSRLSANEKARRRTPIELVQDVNGDSSEKIIEKLTREIRSNERCIG